MKWDLSKMNDWTWRDLPQGTIIPEAGNARFYKTGSWRSERPVLEAASCNHCLLCWIYCPDDAVIIKDEKMVGFDFDHCKGCGICAVECPTKAIYMISEGAVDEIPEAKGTEPGQKDTVEEGARK